MNKRELSLLERNSQMLLLPFVRLTMPPLKKSDLKGHRLLQQESSLSLCSIQWKGKYMLERVAV